MSTQQINLNNTVISPFNHQWGSFLGECPPTSHLPTCMAWMRRPLVDRISPRRTSWVNDRWLFPHPAAPGWRHQWGPSTYFPAMTAKQRKIVQIKLLQNHLIFSDYISIVHSKSPLIISIIFSRCISIMSTIS